ncbi:MAG: M23 family metallopeptidase [Chloroflexi bacterium]|nr:M23 family metallopeptidase [Chloroflexota bacterium]
MVDPKHIHEPPIDPLADTNPSMTVRKVPMDVVSDGSGWRRTVGLLSLIGAAILTLATTVLLLVPAPTPIALQPTALPPTVEGLVVEPTLLPTATLVLATPVPVIVPEGQPTISPDMVQALLQAAPQNLMVSDSLVVQRDNYNPFTFIRQDRPRSETIQYVATDGDTIYTIAERFKLTPETIGWSNNRRYTLVLRPGDVVNIPPVDGVYLQVVGTKTIAEWAAEYKVTDPYVVIDSEYNDLSGAQPTDVPPSGSYIFIPGGQGEDITWNPGVTVDSSGDTARQGFVTGFAPGDPGSCGNVQNPGGGAAWINPLPNGSYVRGFSNLHTGVDRAAAVGTGVRAANSGVVIFAGWNSWGYGNLIVLAHGPFLTLYGHLSSIAVGCGQNVPAGSIIGGVGSTGNSSGPHLHFEIRYGQSPQDPCATLPDVCF